MKNTNNKIIVAGILSAFLISFLYTGSALANTKDSSGDRGEDKASFLSRFHVNFFGAKDNHEDENDKEDINDDSGQHNKGTKMEHLTHDMFMDGQVRGVVIVTGLGENQIQAKDALGSKDRVWKIKTNGDTTFLTRTGESALFSDIKIGDTLSFHGDLTTDVKTAKDSGIFTINADRVRVWGDVDLSAHVKVTGTVTNVDDDNYKLTIDTDNGETITVNASDLTLVGSDSHEKGDFSDIDVGMTVKIKGWWDSLKEKITAFAIKFK